MIPNKCRGTISQKWEKRYTRAKLALACKEQVPALEVLQIGAVSDVTGAAN